MAIQSFTAGAIAGRGKPYTVKLRRGAGFTVRPECEALDGKTFRFTHGWVIGEDDPEMYHGEAAMIPSLADWPDDAPAWIASGDLQAL